MSYHVKFEGGPLDGQRRAFPDSPMPEYRVPIYNPQPVLPVDQSPPREVNYKEGIYRLVWSSAGNWGSGGLYRYLIYRYQGTTS